MGTATSSGRTGPCLPIVDSHDASARLKTGIFGIPILDSVEQKIIIGMRTNMESHEFIHACRTLLNVRVKCRNLVLENCLLDKSACDLTQRYYTKTPTETSLMCIEEIYWRKYAQRCY